MKKSIRVAIVGLPNAGKSTLLNILVGSKNSIVSPTAHTTRGCVLGALNRDETQIIFVDTPGYIRAGTSVWADHFISSIEEAINTVDLVLLVLDAAAFYLPKIEKTLKKFGAFDNLLIAINKADLMRKGDFYAMIDNIMQFGYKEKVFVISAKDATGLDDLEQEILSRAKDGEWIAKNNEQLKQEKEKYVAECVREKAFYCLKDELPFNLWTVRTHSNFEKKPWIAYVDIVVAKKSHRGMAIGKGGSQIKQIGEAARIELQSMWGDGQLFLNVVVDQKSLDDRDFVSYICNSEHLPSDSTLSNKDGD